MAEESLKLRQRAPPLQHSPLTHTFSLRFADPARALPAERGIDFALRYLEPHDIHAPCLASMLKLYGASQEGPNA
jgi:hypothetical protein